MTIYVFERDVKRKSAKILDSEVAFNCSIFMVILRSFQCNSALLHQRLIVTESQFIAEKFRKGKF
jgi:hypothetical protein